MLRGTTSFKTRKSRPTTTSSSSTAVAKPASTYAGRWIISSPTTRTPPISPRHADAIAATLKRSTSLTAAVKSRLWCRRSSLTFSSFGKTKGNCGCGSPSRMERGITCPTQSSGNALKPVAIRLIMVATTIVPLLLSERMLVRRAATPDASVRVANAARGGEESGGLPQ